jgi:CheY-like chemotaxis protein
MKSIGSILLVEDEPLILEMVADALRDLGYNVQEASDGRVAAQFLDSPTHFDILVSDVSMPNGISGIDLARRQNQARPRMRVVLASGFARSQLPEIPEGVILIAKPYRVGELFALCSSLLEEALISDNGETRA